MSRELAERLLKLADTRSTSVADRRWPTSAEADEIGTLARYALRLDDALRETTANGCPVCGRDNVTQCRGGCALFEIREDHHYQDMAQAGMEEDEDEMEEEG